MQEKELIRTIKELKKIKPRKDWVLLTKEQILGTSTELSTSEEKRFELFPLFKPAYAGLFLLLFVVGLLGISSSALPGEPLYVIKRISERTQAALVPQEEESRLNLELANRRLEELGQIAKNNEVKKLAPAINEFQASVSQAAKKIASGGKPNKETVAQIIRLEEAKKDMEKTYGIAGLEASAESDPTKMVAEMLIEDTEQRTLSQEQLPIFEEAKTLYQEGNYSEALIKILSLSQTN